MRRIARKLYLFLISKDDEKSDDWWPYRSGLVHWLGEFGWPKRA